MQKYDIEQIKKEHKPSFRIPLILTILSLALSAGLFAWGIGTTNAQIAEEIEAEEEALLDAGQEAAHDVDLGNTLRKSSSRKWWTGSPYRLTRRLRSAPWM